MALVFFDIPVLGQLYADTLSQLHRRLVADGDEDTVHLHHLRCSVTVIDKLHLLNPVLSPDLFDLGVEQDRYFLVRETFGQMGLGPQGIPPVNQGHLDADLVQVQGFGDGAVTSADDDYLSFLE